MKKLSVSVPYVKKLFEQRVHKFIHIYRDLSMNDPKYEEDELLIIEEIELVSEFAIGEDENPQ